MTKTQDHGDPKWTLFCREFHNSSHKLASRCFKLDGRVRRMALAIARDSTAWLCPEPRISRMHSEDPDAMEEGDVLRPAAVLDMAGHGEGLEAVQV